MIANGAALAESERLQEALERFAADEASDEDRELLRAAVKSGALLLVTGERAVALGGDANGAVWPMTSRCCGTTLVSSEISEVDPRFRTAC